MLTFLLLAVSAQNLGVFEGHADLGTVLTPGTVEFRPAEGAYVVSGSGDNMWAASDSFHFVWKKVTGDVTLTADLAFLTAGGNGHKKGVLMIRQSLDADAAYCDAALHGDGLTSLQCRERQSGPTFEIRQAIAGARRLRIEKRGSDFTVSAAAAGQALQFTGGSVKLPMEGTFYVGLGVCAHDKNAVERVTFTNFTIGAPATDQSQMRSTLEVAPVRGDRRAVYVAEGMIEAPVWSADGKSLEFISKGKRKRVAATGGPVASTAEADRPVISPDGRTRLGVAKRRRARHIYSQPVGGGAKTWLTKAKTDGSNDHPQFAADGQSIWFDSDRSGVRQIWRMALDGSQPEQITKDARHNWMPRLSPDGKGIAMLSAETAPLPSARAQDLSLRVLTLATQSFATLAKFTGGQGSLSSPWSPDGRFLTFVSYQSGSR